jgi:hypothetical protein
VRLNQIFGSGPLALVPYIAPPHLSAEFDFACRRFSLYLYLYTLRRKSRCSFERRVGPLSGSTQKRYCPRGSARKWTHTCIAFIACSVYSLCGPDLYPHPGTLVSYQGSWVRYWWALITIVVIPLPLGLKTE